MALPRAPIGMARKELMPTFWRNNKGTDAVLMERTDGILIIGVTKELLMSSDVRVLLKVESCSAVNSG